MRQFGMWALLALSVAVIVVRDAEARVIVKRQAELDPGYQALDSVDDESVRDKRHQDVKFGVKNALLGFVFNPSAASSNAARNNNKPATSTTKKPTTTEDIVIFEKNQPVSLDFPDQLFGSSFELVTNLSKTAGNFMMNSALRTQRLLESMRPFIWKIFGKKGVVIEAITDKPIFSDGTST